MSDLTSWLEAHQLLWPLDEFRSLGRFHACIDAADVKIEAKMHDEVSGEGLGPFKRLELASFGREVGCDVPRWWVFTRASNVQSLLDRTELTFPAAQRLLRSAERVCREMVPTYEQIIRELGGFLQRSKSEIEALCAYVDYLDAEHEFAPAILFSYAVWGSTRRADRSLADYFDREKLEEARRVCLAGELALGVLNSTAPMLILERNELLSEIDEEVDETAIRDRLLHITQIRIRENLVEYFRDIRDSLRHIYTLCQEFSQRETIYSDDRFMRRLIKKISNQGSVTESELWDIKETLAMWCAQREDREAKVIKFAEIIAAFANKRGGVLLIGITNKTHEVVGVDDAENRIKDIEARLRECIGPQLDFVRTRAVPISDGTGRSCIVVVVGQTDKPMSVRQKNNSYSYPLRVGPGIERVTPEQIWTAKAHMKGTNFSFASELEAWVSDVE